MKKYLAGLMMACTLFATTTLSAAGYWETIKEYLPDWHDFVPGMARSQVEQIQAAKPKPVAKVNPKPVHAKKPAPAQIAAKKPEPKPAPAPVVAKKPEPVAPEAPVKLTAKQRRRQKLKEQQLAKQVAVVKPTSEPIAHPSKVSPPQMDQKIDFEKGMHALSALVATPPFAIKNTYDNDAFSGLMNCVNALVKEMKSNPMVKVCGQLNQSVNELFPKAVKRRGNVAAKKPAIILQQFQKNLVTLGALGKNCSEDTFKKAIKATLINAQKQLNSRNVNVQSIHAQLLAVKTLAEGAKHPSASQLQQLAAASQGFNKKRNGSRVLVGNMGSVLKSL